MAKRKISNTLALAVLGLLQEQPRHPYELASTLRERHKDSSFKVNSGSLYDTVEALVRHGWIEPVETARDGRRPERTVYATTELGRSEFVRWIDELLRTPVAEYPKFMAAVSYLGALGPDRAAEALGERAGHLAQRIDETNRVLADTVGSGAVPRLFMIEVECALHAWEAELTWTRRTIAEIRDGSLFWPEVERTEQGWTWSAPSDGKGSSR
ncbi:PadR family transcriptional regulator [Streptomyces griseoluteus]|uniref:PadR family transcriptional regulator n=1 Tax=Streptomyces griseoluteus TaxID=29306 RepID=UPI0036FAEEEE